MNGLPLPDISNSPNISDTINTDPLVLIDQNHKQQMELLQQQRTEEQTNITRDTNNRLRMLEREYAIREQALKRKWDATPRRQRDEESYQQEWQEYNDLMKNFQIKASGIQGKIQPDLKDLEAKWGLIEQKAEADRAQRIEYIQLIRQLQEQGIISNPAAATKAQFQIAGINLPMTAFQQPDPTEELVRLGMQATNLEKQGKYQTADAVRRRMAEITGKVSPDIVRGTKAATRLSGLEGRRKKRQVEKEGPGTLAEGIIQVKNKTLGAGKYAFMPRSKAEKEKPIYQKSRTTGQTRVSYDGGKTWQVIG